MFNIFLSQLETNRCMSSEEMSHLIFQFWIFTIVCVTCIIVFTSKLHIQGGKTKKKHKTNTS